MQTYRPRTMLAKAGDHLLRMLLTSAAGIGWFVYLWGLSLPAILSGLALGTLLWLCLRALGQRVLKKRETQLRRVIGGELALERLLLLAPEQAVSQAAQWLIPRYSFTPEQTEGWYAQGTLNGERALLCLIAQHASQPVSAQQVVKCARRQRMLGLPHCLICLTAPAAHEAFEYAGHLEPPVQLIPRDELIGLAGDVSPATDDDLRMLGRRSFKRRTAREWAAVILHPSRARRYFWYGVGLSALAAATGMNVYPVPAALCLGLYAACKYREIRGA